MSKYKRKSSGYNGTIAEIYTGSDYKQLRDTWYVPGNQQFEGTWNITREYIDNKPTFAVFIEGSEIEESTDKERFIRWNGDSFWEYCREFGSEDVCNKNSTKESFTNDLFYNDNYYSASKLTLRYRHDLENIDVPSIPSLLNPSSNAIENETVDYSWSESSGGGNITYHLQVDNNSTFSSPFYNQSDLSSTSKSISNHSPNTTYYWRVRALNTAGESDWSNAREFTVEPLPPAAPLVSGSVFNGHPKLSWPSTGASSYEIYKRTDSGDTWLIWTTTTSTVYIDQLANVDGYQGKAYDGFGNPYVAYYVKSKSESGAVSAPSSSHYFDLVGITPYQN